ncbi:hypothetical protein [Clavibacter tessellarius]
MTSPDPDLRALLGDLVTAGHRLTRLAAHEVGGTARPPSGARSPCS